MLLEGVDLEMHDAAVRPADLLGGEIDGDRSVGAARGVVHQLLQILRRHHDRQDAVLEAVVVENVGLRVVTLKATETADLVLTVGDGTAMIKEGAGWVAGATSIPLYAGVPVEEGFSYGFTCQVFSQVGGITATPYLLWFDMGGQPTDLLSKTTGNPVSPASQAWTEIIAQGTAPEDAVYMVPAIKFATRPASTNTVYSPFLDIAGATAYLLSAAGKSVAVVPPDNYLTMGDPGEVIGAPDPTVPFEGYVLGEPPEETV